MKAKCAIVSVVLLVLSSSSFASTTALSSNPKPTHDIAVTKVSASSSCVQGDTVHVVVTVENQGNRRESFEVTLTDATNGTEVGTQLVSLPSKQSLLDNIVDKTFDGENAGDYYGTWVRARGDLNGDNYDDIAITANRIDNNTGRVYVYYGKPNISDIVVDLTLTGEATDNYFGQCVDMGDVNGDGYDDLVVGAWGYNDYDGRVYLYYGGTDFDGTADKIFEGESGLTSWFGARTYLGDVNGDKYDDLAVGAINWGVHNGYERQGRAYIYYGASSTNMDTTCDLTYDGEQISNQDYARVMSIGKDVNGDSYGDIVIAAKYWGNDQGRAYFYYGGNPPDTTPSLTFTGENAGDKFGKYFDVGDINNDNFADIVLGACRYNRGQGRVYIYYGKPRTQMDLDCDLIINGETPAHADFGIGVLIEDIDNDGIADLLVGGDDYPNSTYRGKMYLYYGSSSFDTRCDMTFTGEVINSNFGRLYDAGDLDNDGYPEIVVSAWSYPNRTYQGRAYIYKGGGRSSSKDIAFFWDTTVASSGKHTLKAEISPVSGEEDTADNSMTITVNVKEPSQSVDAPPAKD